MDKSVLQVHKVATMQIYYTSSYINKSKYWGRVPQGLESRGYTHHLSHRCHSLTPEIKKKERKKRWTYILPIVHNRYMGYTYLDTWATPLSFSSLFLNFLSLWLIRLRSDCQVLRMLKIWALRHFVLRAPPIYQPCTQVSQSNTRNRNKKKKETVNIHPPHRAQQISGLHLL